MEFVVKGFIAAWEAMHQCLRALSIQCLQDLVWILPKLSAKPGELDQISTPAPGMQTPQLLQMSFRKQVWAQQKKKKRNEKNERERKLWWPTDDYSQTSQVTGLIWTNLEILVLCLVRIWCNFSLCKLRPTARKTVNKLVKNTFGVMNSSESDLPSSAVYCLM